MTSGVQVIAVATAAGLRIRVDGDNLRIAPAYLVTPVLRTALSEYKKEILELLKTELDNIQTLTSIPGDSGDGGDGVGAPKNREKTEAPSPTGGEKAGVTSPTVSEIGLHHAPDGAWIWFGKANGTSREPSDRELRDLYYGTSSRQGKPTTRVAPQPAPQPVRSHKTVYWSPVQIQILVATARAQLRGQKSHIEVLNLSLAWLECQGQIVLGEC